MSSAKNIRAFFLFVCVVCLVNPYAQAAQYDVLLANGTVYDGTGSTPRKADIALRGDRIVAIGDVQPDQAALTLDVRGLAVAPGFINMLSWATDSLLIDGRSQGDIRQGVTLEVFGEGMSMGPLNPAMRAMLYQRQTEAKFDIPWTTLGQYLEHLEARGIAPNVASFVGATTVRIHELGFIDRAPNADELKNMQNLVRQAMEEGAMGVGSSLIYAPAFYAKTEELIALMEAAAPYGGMYISHMRSEGNRLLESVDELITIARESRAPAEIYHLKQSGQSNWGKLDPLIKKVEAARAEGLAITADMYTYPAGSTGLDAAMPPWVQEGGYEAWVARLKNPATRSRVVEEMAENAQDWENLLHQAGAEGTLLVGFKNPLLRKYIGKTLAEVAQELKQSPAQAAIDLVIEDGSRVQVVYFLMSEKNIERQVQLPWMSFGSDAGSLAAEGVFLLQGTHPRAYGNFARVLGLYTRDKQLLSVAEAVRKLSGLPAKNLKVRERGLLKEGYYADIAIFDPAAVQDHATFAEPHQYSTGMIHVFVNGTHVLKNGDHTGALPGRVVRGPGWTGWK